MVEGAELNRQLFVLYRGELALPEPIREKGQPGERCTYKGSSPCQNWGAKADGATERKRIWGELRGIKLRKQLSLLGMKTLIESGQKDKESFN